MPNHLPWIPETKSSIFKSSIEGQWPGWYLGHTVENTCPHGMYIRTPSPPMSPAQSRASFSIRRWTALYWLLPEMYIFIIISCAKCLMAGEKSRLAATLPTNSNILQSQTICQQSCDCGYHRFKSVEYEQNSSLDLADAPLLYCDKPYNPSAFNHLISFILWERYLLVRSMKNVHGKSRTM